MKKVKKLLSLGIAAVLSLSLVACGSSTPASNESESTSTSAPESTEEVTLNLAYQYGLAYAPLVFCQENNLIEKAYSEATGKTVKVVWNQMSSGADINTGIASQSLDAGFMGVGPALTGISKNTGYKVFSNISGQTHGMMSNNPDINSLGDLIGSSEQIALVNIGSFQHIILGLALEKNGYDAHALDSNIVAMKHPDGMAAVESGSLACHLTSNPYIYKERNNDALHELTEVTDVWSADKSFIIGVASESLYQENPELYKALCTGVSNAIDLINSDYEAAAKVTCEYDGNTYEDELFYLQAGTYTASTSGLLELASFMYNNGFIEKELSSYSDIVFDNVTGD